MKVTYYGHACLGIEINGKNIIIDPFITANELAKHINIKDLKADYIIITHAHLDHLLDAEALVEQTAATIISNGEIANYYEGKGLRTAAMNTGGSAEYSFGRLKSTIAFHSSSFADGTYGGNPNGYIIESGNKRIYIAGDTGLTQEMKLIPETVGKLDLAVLPIGDRATMGVKDAIIASDFIQCNRILGYHFDTFPSIKIDKRKAIAEFDSKNKELILLDIGKHISV